MDQRIRISFERPARPDAATVLLFASAGPVIGKTAKACDSKNLLPRTFEAAGFSGRMGTHVDLFAPAGTNYGRLTIIGVGDKLATRDWCRLGGLAAAALGEAGRVSVVLELAGQKISAPDAAEFAQGMVLRSYSFDAYKSEKTGREKPVSVTIHCSKPAAARRAFADAAAVADGIMLARDLVNEPANMLGTVAFAARAASLADHGVKIEILTETELSELGMGALLGVAQGSGQPPRLVVMRWNGGEAGRKPIAFVGKGVVFDAGGITMKPPAGMVGMKGDMGGAAAVTGLLKALALRKAKVNAVGIIPLVENMVDGNAQRPGDVVRSMSGQTIEITNTDAEGRLILCDALHYCRTRFDPCAMIDLATLTYAIIMALGHHYAGMFCNDDALADELSAAGLTTGEKVWRMPLTAEYDEALTSDIADVKNFGGGLSGSVPAAGGITSARFIQRFVGGIPWAHLDIAGTAMDSPKSEISRGWASGYGVKLLDRFVAVRFE